MLRLVMQAVRQLVNGSHTHLPHAWVVICELTSILPETYPLVHCIVEKSSSCLELTLLSTVSLKRAP